MITSIRCATLRARPVISIRRNIKTSPQEIDLTIKTCGNSIWWVFYFSCTSTDLAVKTSHVGNVKTSLSCLAH